MSMGAPYAMLGPGLEFSPVTRPVRVLVDLDDVLADWNGHLDKLMDNHPSLHDVPRKAERVSWDWDEVTDEQYALLRAIMDEPHFYQMLLPLPGAQEGVAALEASGAEVFLVSSPLLTNHGCPSEKYEWVREYFGPSLAQRLILTHDKTVIHGDVLIDDKPKITGANVRPSWRRIIFDQPWNQGVAGVRLSSWDHTDVQLAISEAFQ